MKGHVEAITVSLPKNIAKQKQHISDGIETINTTIQDLKNGIKHSASLNLSVSTLWKVDGFEE
jgi:hypothetical protein